MSRIPSKWMDAERGGGGGSAAVHGGGERARLSRAGHLIHVREIDRKGQRRHRKRSNEPISKRDTRRLAAAKHAHGFHRTAHYVLQRRK